MPSLIFVGATMRHTNLLVAAAAISLSQTAYAGNVVTYHDCKNQDGTMSYRIYPCEKNQTEVQHFDVDLDECARLESRKSTVGVSHTQQVQQSNARTSGWVKVTTIDDEDGHATVYANPASIIANGNVTQLTSLFDLVSANTLNGKRFLSFIMQSEYDCKLRLNRVMNAVFFSGNMGAGQVIGRTAGHTGSWKPHTSPLSRAACQSVSASQATAATGTTNASSGSIQAFCREAFGEYWQGVEECIRGQTAAKQRIGH